MHGPGHHEHFEWHGPGPGPHGMHKEPGPAGHGPFDHPPGAPFGGPLPPRPPMPPMPPPPGPPMAWGAWTRPAPKVKRGDVRAAVLSLLAEGPRNGYQIIQEISERSGGVWRPSPGSVYPALQQLEDEGLIQAEQTGGRRLFHLTEEGQAYVEEHADELAAPWETIAESVDDAAMEVHTLLGQLHMAVAQATQAASPAQIGEVRKVLANARRAIYRILAADSTDEPDD
ncbi:MAG TPA: PadR family transcriptional regulator [Streptosporangiaceae bacterium]